MHGDERRNVHRATMPAMSDQLAIDFRADAERDIERLIPIALELARAAGEQGVTVASLRSIAVARGILTGQEKGRRLSYLGVVLKRAGLRPTGEYRRSHIDRSHGNLHAVYVLPKFGSEGAA